MKAPEKTTFDRLEKWFVDNTSDSKAPFSVVLRDVAGVNGAKEDSFACRNCLGKRWTVKSQWGESKKGKTLKTVYSDPVSALEFTVDAVFYSDVPTLDYVVTVRNTSSTHRSPIISDLNPLDLPFPLKAENGAYKLGNGNGSIARANDFEAKDYELCKEKLSFEEPYGRSTDDRWPFFDIDGENGGLLLAIAWSGNWTAEFEKISDDAVGLKVGMYNFNSFLLPGESIRTERIVLVYHEGDNEYGHNLFRKTVIAHYTPYCDREDKEFVPPICINYWGGTNIWAIKKNTEKMVRFGVKADLVWLDAAWYGHYPFLGVDRTVGWNANSGGPWYAQLGIWEDNRRLYPNGMKEVADYLHTETPYKLMLWWMLEDGRVNPYTQTYTDLYCREQTIKVDVLARQTFGKESYYRELIDVPGGRAVLKLSDEKVFKKVLNYYRNRFSNDGIDFMRIDYWSRPAAAWVVNDKDESAELCGEGVDGYRNGMTENKYICNLYRFFDTMYEEYPDWLLDNCCSGGRRLDLEMARRGIPLWRTDYNNANAPDYDEANQVQTQYLNRWLPYTGIGCARPDDDHYRPRSFYCAGPCFSPMNISDEMAQKYKDMVDEYVEIRPYWSGDYYQLLPVANNKTDWQAYELYREDLGSGMLVSIIREQTTESEEDGAMPVRTFKLRGLDPEAKYKVHDIDDKEAKEDYVASGKDLMEKGIRCFGKQKTVQNHIFTKI